MLIKLSPDKLSEAWPMVCRAIKSSSIALAEMTDERINNVLRSLLAGSATCWIHDKGSSITTVVITTITEEPISKTFNLLIYCAHMFSKCKAEEYIEMAKDISNYGKSLDCSRVIIYCSNDKLTKIFKDNGAQAIYSLIVFPVMNF
jgi:hypothetical protein